MSKCLQDKEKQKHQIQKTDKSGDAVVETAALDTDLSLRAKGMIALLAALPAGYSQTEESLAELASDGRTAVRSALRELESKKYISRGRAARADDGRIRRTVITLQKMED